MWAFSLDSGRSRHSHALDSLDVVSSFVAGRGALVPSSPSYALHSTGASHTQHAVHGSWEGALSHSARMLY